MEMQTQFTLLLILDQYTSLLEFLFLHFRVELCVCMYTYTHDALNAETKKIFKNVEISLACAYPFLELDTHHCVHRLNQNNVLKDEHQIPVRGHRLK